jgi:hypothetical protein
MKKIILLLLVLFACKAYPQGYFYSPEMWNETDTTYAFFSLINFYGNQSPCRKADIIKYKVHEWKSQYYHFNKKGKQEQRNYSVSTFDTRGNIVSRKSYDEKNVLWRNNTYLFNDSNRIVSFVSINKKGKITQKDSATYRPDGKQTGEMGYRRGGLLLKTKNTITYNAKGMITEQSYFKYSKKGIEKPTGKYLTVYNPDGTKGETKYYNGKGKLEHTWSFDCNPEGASQKKALIDSTKVCIKYEYGPDGSKIKSIIYTNRKNHITKCIMKYNPSGDLTDFEYYNHKNKITSKSLYAYNNFKNCTSIIDYKRGGEIIRSKTVMEYNDNKQLTKYMRYRHDKLKDSHLYEYDEKGLNTVSTAFNRKGKKHWLTQNSFVFN